MGQVNLGERKAQPLLHTGHHTLRLARTGANSGAQARICIEPGLLGIIAPTSLLQDHCNPETPEGVALLHPICYWEQTELSIGLPGLGGETTSYQGEQDRGICDISLRNHYVGSEVTYGPTPFTINSMDD